jgi:asparagine synthase (glutamine-hydrolysing)
MCGIVGSFSKNSTPGLDELLQESLLALHHRGPDDRGKEVLQFDVGQLALGHTRLSVIDISQRGHQPMHSPDDLYTIMFNGENI